MITLEKNPGYEDVPVPPGTVWHVTKVVEVTPDLARCNRRDRRVLEALARKYGWQFRDTRERP